MTNQLNADDTILGLAAAVTTRACELITDGWTKGAMHRTKGGAPVSFCVHGAIALAMEETFGVMDLNQEVQRDVEQVAVAFVCDEAFGDMKRATGGIPVASYNDASARRHDEVIGVMDRAATRLWSIAMDSETVWEQGRWTTEMSESEPAKQFLYASLA